MTATEASFSSADGTRLFERAWMPQAAPRGAALIVHGYAEHSGRYAWTGEQLASHGFAVEAFDLRGHGQSDGERVLIGSMNEYLDDVDAALARLRQHAPDLPVFILGHSMGGAILALYATARLQKPGHDDVRGLIFSGAALGRTSPQPAIVTRLVILLGRFAPKVGLIKLAAADVSRDPAVVADYDADPLNYRGRMPAGLLAALIRGGRYTAAHASEITIPLLILHGSEDALAAVDGSQRLFDKASSPDKTIKIYEGLAHEILNEPEKELVLDDIVRWLDRQLAKSTPATPPVNEASTTGNASTSGALAPPTAASLE
jgi:alpha-beta hydrolase superfamily lysophospholipase